MPHLVLDTNVAISGLLWSGAASRIFDLEEEGRITFGTSPLLLHELFEVLSRSRFNAVLSQHWLSPLEAVELYRGRCRVVSDTILPVKIIDDPNDDIVLGCALAHAADYLISGDAHLLSLRKFAGITIVNAAKAVAEILST